MAGARGGWMLLLAWGAWCSGCDGCGAAGDTASTNPGGAASADAQGSTTAAVASATVMVSYEGQAAAPIVLRGAERLLLREQLPEAGRDPLKWRGLQAQATGKRELALRRYGEVYGASHEVYLYLNAAERPALGVFRRISGNLPDAVKAQLSKPHLELADVQTVEVRTSELAQQEDKLADLDIDVGGTSQRISGDAIAALTPSKRNGALEVAGRRRNAKRGWALADVLGLAKARLPKGATVTVHGIEGGPKQLTAAELADPQTAALLRYNRRGALVFELWRAGDKRPSERLKGVHKLVVSAGG